MADSFLPYKNPDTTDAKLDSESLTVGSDTVERERIQIAGKGAAEIAEVKNAPPAKDHHGVVTRPVKTGVILATVSDAKTATGVVGSQQDIGARFFSLQLSGTWVGSVGLEESSVRRQAFDAARRAHEAGDLAGFGDPDWPRGDPRAAALLAAADLPPDLARAIRAG